MASCTPVAPSECPVIDLVDEIAGISCSRSANTSRMASSSVISPTGVLVPWLLM